MPRLVLALAVACAVALPAPPPLAAQGRPNCAQVIRQMHRITGHDGAGTPDPDVIARKLDTDAEWVERCAISHGRRVKRREVKRSEGDEGLSPRREWKEYEEVAREERDMEANYAQGDPDNYKDRDRARGIDPDSSAEWEPFITHEWQPYVTHEWAPFIKDDDDPGFE